MSHISRLVSIIVVLLLGSSAPVGAWPVVPRFLPGDLDPRTETLLDATTDGLPSEFAVASVMRWALQPSPKPLVMPPHGGPALLMVEHGHLTATQHGVETRLAAGEIFSPGDYTQEVVLQASGVGEASVFVVAFQALGFASACFWVSDPLVHTQDVLIQTPVDALAGRSGRVRFERLTLPPGTALPPLEASPLMWTSVGEGVLGLTLEGQLPYFWEPGQERTFRPGQPWPQIPDPIPNPLLSGRTRMMLRNAGDDPLVLFRLTLTASGGEMAPADSPPGGPPLF